MNAEKDEIDELLDKVIMSVESDYLIIENRKRCRAILLKQDKTEEDMMDLFIYLHIILEVSLNGLFRNISLSNLKKGIDELEVSKNLDNISFMDKTIMFIYDSSFDFDGKLDDATSFHKVIGKLKEFSGIRNELLHGHTIKMVNNNGNKTLSHLKSQLTPDNMHKQINRFKFIIDGITFYLSCLITVSDKDKEGYYSRYLNYDFIPNDIPE